jgi:hypothetical protein
MGDVDWPPDLVARAELADANPALPAPAPFVRRRDLPASHAGLERCAHCPQTLGPDRLVAVMSNYILCWPCYGEIAALLRRFFEQPSPLTMAEAVALHEEIKNFARSVPAGTLP